MQSNLNQSVKESDVVQSKNTNSAKTSLKQLLLEIPRTNFKDTSLGEQKDGKLTRKDFIVIVIEELLELAKIHDWHLRTENGCISIYDGKKWAEIPSEEFMDFLGNVALKMGVDVLEAKYHRFKLDLLNQFVASSYLPISFEEEPTVKLNCQNDTLHITDGEVELKAHNPNDNMKYVLPFEYNPLADCPMFKQFLNEVLPDKSKQNVLAEYLGSIFIKNKVLKLEKMLLLYGGGSNGKSVVFEVLNALLGEENVSSYSLESLTLDTNGYYRAMIGKKLVNYASEISTKINVNVLKQLASGEPLDAREPYGKPFMVRDYAKLIFNANQLPDRVENTEGFFRRFLIIHFDQTIPESKQDRQLSQKIIENELPGVLNWILAGLNRLLAQKGFTHSLAVERALKKYKAESDSVYLWMFENDWSSSEGDYITLQQAFNYYREYCMASGYYYIDKTKFRKALESHNIRVKRLSVGFVVYLQKRINND